MGNRLTLNMADKNTLSAAAADEKAKEGRILIAGITNLNKILCLQPPETSGPDGENAAKIINQANKEIHVKNVHVPGTFDAWVWDHGKKQTMFRQAGVDGLTFWAFADGDNTLKPKICLDNIQKAFEQELDKSGQSAAKMQYQTGFESTLAENMKNPRSAKDKELIKREQVISVNLENADALVKSTSAFKDTSHAVKKKYCWENAKCWIGIAVIVVLIIIILVIAICVSTGCK